MVSIPKIVVPKSTKSLVKTQMKASTSTATGTFLTAAERIQLRKLSTMLPPAPKCSEAQVIFNAVNHINSLTALIRARVANGTLPIESLNSLPSVDSPTPITTTSTRHRHHRRAQKKRPSMEKKR